MCIYCLCFVFSFQYAVTDQTVVQAELFTLVHSKATEERNILYASLTAFCLSATGNATYVII